MLALPREYIGSLCEVKSLDNELLAVGRIIKIDTEALEIAAQDDERMPLLQYRIPVKLFTHNSRLDTQILVGTVYLSTDNFVRVESVRPLQDFERRAAFRVNSNVPGTLTLLLTPEERADFDRKLATMPAQEIKQRMEHLCFEVRVMDISLTGVRLQAPFPLLVGTRYVIDFTPLQDEMSFYLTVKRLVSMPNGETHFGCIFFDTTDRQMDNLFRDLFQLQRLEKNRKRNAPTAL